MGVPAIWLVREQMSRQAWGEVGQASRAAQAPYAAQLHLRELVAHGEEESLVAYLDALRVGAALDSVVVCTPDEEQIAQTGRVVAAEVCCNGGQGRLQVLSVGSPPEVWLLSSCPIGGEAADLICLNAYGFFDKLVAVTTGNIFGGGFLVAAVYWFIYRRPKVRAQDEADQASDQRVPVPLTGDTASG